MATSLIVFEFVGGPGEVFNYHPSLKEAYFEANFNPPANIAGKLCYLESKYFNWAPASRNINYGGAGETYLLGCSWSQVHTVYTINNTTSPNVPVAAQEASGGMIPLGPVLVHIPSGPQTVRFIVSLGNNVNDYSGLTGDESARASFQVIFSIVEANSRQTPLG